MSSLALGPTHLPAQWVPWNLSLVSRGQGTRQNTCLHLVPRLWKNGIIAPPLLYFFTGKLRLYNYTLLLERIILVPPLPIDSILGEDWTQKHISQLANSIHHILQANYLLQRGERIRILIYFLGISDYEGRLIQNATSGSFTWFCPNCPCLLEERSELPFCTYVLQQIRGSRHDAEPSQFVSCSENIRLMTRFAYTKHRLISYRYVQLLKSISG